MSCKLVRETNLTRQYNFQCRCFKFINKGDLLKKVKMVLETWNQNWI